MKLAASTLAIAVFAVFSALSASAATDAVTGSFRPAQTLVVNQSAGAPRGTDPVVFDSFTGAATLTTTTGSPRTFMGGVFSAAGAGPQVDISALTVYLAATAAGSYTNVRVNVQFWNVYTAAGTPVFSSPASAVFSADLGPFSPAANTFSTVELTPPTPIRLDSLANKGITISYQGDSGAGLVTTDALTSLITAGGAISVGSWNLNGGNGIFRNASSRTDYNFLSTDLRTFGTLTDARIGLILNGNATVPVALQSFGVE